ncbi:MAG: hypothetical protein NTX25_18455 [Proteobacteria bacterium]|nr:hypothetical protein [Pseudomonadota bacterium]
MERPEKLIVLDIDNTVFNWVEYYVNCMEALFQLVSQITQIKIEILHEEAQTI